MSRRLPLSLCLVAGICSLGVGCKKPDQPLPITQMEKNYDWELPPGMWGLGKVSPENYPDFGAAWYRCKGTELRRAVQYSISYLNKPSSKKYFPSGEITHDRAMASLQDFLHLIDEANSPGLMNQLIRERYDVYMSVGCDNEGTVLFTGYYSPIFNGSMTQTDQFKYPLYKLPPGLQKDSEGNPVGGMWRTREEIETTGICAGNELIWLEDPFEAYVLTVQGSGFVRLPDDTLYEIGYAGHNGHDYVPIGRLMVAEGKIPKSKLSLATLIQYFRDHPEDIAQYLHQNKRYVFFQEAKGGPYGCLGQPVTPMHSIATDKDIFPRACLSFISTDIPSQSASSSSDKRPYNMFVLDQDRGAAIRAPGRCDIYMGVGDEAGRVAGYTYQEGKLYYLFLKEDVTTASRAPEIE